MAMEAQIINIKKEEENSPEILGGDLEVEESVSDGLLELGRLLALGLVDLLVGEHNLNGAKKGKGNVRKRKTIKQQPR